MEETKKFLLKVLSTWASIGTLVAVFANTGFISLPEVLLNLFSVEFQASLEVLFQAIITFAGALISFYQILRGVLNLNQSEVKSSSTNEKIKFTINPFKVYL